MFKTWQFKWNLDVTLFLEPWLIFIFTFSNDYTLKLIFYPHNAILKPLLPAWISHNIHFHPFLQANLPLLPEWLANTPWAPLPVLCWSSFSLKLQGDYPPFNSASDLCSLKQLLYFVNVRNKQTFQGESSIILAWNDIYFTCVIHSTTANSMIFESEM